MTKHIWYSKEEKNYYETLNYENHSPASALFASIILQAIKDGDLDWVRSKEAAPYFGLLNLDHEACVEALISDRDKTEGYPEYFMSNPNYKRCVKCNKVKYKNSFHIAMRDKAMSHYAQENNRTKNWKCISCGRKSK